MAFCPSVSGRARCRVYGESDFFCREEEETVGLILYGKGEGFGMAGVM